MLQVKLPVVDTLHPQSTNCNKFATGVQGTTIQVTQNGDSAREERRGKGTTRAFSCDFPGNTTSIIVLQYNI